MLIPERPSIILLAKVFVASVCFILMMAVLWNVWWTRQEKLKEATVVTFNMSRALAQHAEDTFKEANSVMISLMEILDHDGKDPVALARIERLMAVQVRELSQLNGLIITDKNGDWLANSAQLPNPGRSSKDSTYFSYHQSHESLRAYIDGPTRNRETSDLILTISKRINQADGSFDGIMIAAIDLQYFSAFYNNFDVGNDGALMLAMNNGRVLVDHAITGKNRQGGSMEPNHIAQTYFEIGQIEPAKIESIHYLNNYPIFVAVALSADEVLADWITAAIFHVLALIVLISLVTAFGMKLTKEIRLRVDAETKANEEKLHIESLNRMLNDLAMQDELTGLANRRCFNEEIIKELRRAARKHEPFSLIMLDVDHFKGYNDTYGHLAGDECLRKIAATVRSMESRQGDLAARYGGEEIVVMLPNCDRKNAIAIAETILQKIRLLAISHAANPIGIVTVSAGVGVLESVDQSDSPNKIIAKADKALYIAKSDGRNCIAAC